MLVAGLGPASASTTYLCKGYDSCASAGKSHYGYKTAKVNMYWSMYSGNNCTNYVAYRFVKRKYDAMSNTRPWSGGGMAYQWGSYNASRTNTTPAVGAVAWWNSSAAPSLGHVSYVEKVVSSSEIWVSESNAGGYYPEFAWKKITKSGGGWPTGFIHFKDEDLNASTSPSIAGSPKVGVRLTANKGTWKSSSGTTPTAAVSYRYQWRANGTAISGATSSTYTPTTGTVGKRISVSVTTSATGYKGASATSAQTGYVAKGTLTNTASPSVSGTPKVGTTLTGTKGTWSPTPSIYAYQWLANGVAIAGATSTTLTLTPAHKGQQIALRVTAKLSGYTDAAKTSLATTTVAPGDLATQTAPAITGVAAVGETLTAISGTWSPTPTSTSYQWRVDGVDIEGATGSTYSPSSDVIGRAITVAQTGQRDGYLNSTQESAPTTAVQGHFVPATPNIVGEPVSGQELTVDLGVWEPEPTTFSFQWLRDGVPILGATQPTYTPSDGDVGGQLSVIATGARLNYADTAVTSPATAPVASAPVGGMLAP